MSDSNHRGPAPASAVPGGAPDDSFDVVVVGAGPAGYVCAIRAAQLGRRVAVVDRQWIGGVCLNVGCIPSKALLRNAELVHTITHRAADFGLTFDGFRADYRSAVARSRAVSAQLTRGIEFLLKKNKIELIVGEALFEGPQVVRVGDRRLDAANLVIATGSSSMVPPGVEIDGQAVQNSWQAIVDERLPNTAVIVGASAIGVEFATVWSAYGCQVTLIEMAPRVVPLEDEDVSKELNRQLRKRGIAIRTGTVASGVRASEDGKAVVTIGDEVLTVDRVLVATGIRPNSAGLEATGVTLDRRGYIEIDDRMATAAPGVWAIGDVTGKLALAHVGQAQGVVCAEAIAGHDTPTLSYIDMPRATYCAPQIASFGLTEAQAREQIGDHVATARFEFGANGKALGMGEGSGFVKLVSDARYGELLGAHLIGPEVTELLPELTLARANELTVAEIARNVHAHPTLSEALLDAVHGLTTGYIHK